MLMLVYRFFVRSINPIGMSIIPPLVFRFKFLQKK